MKRKKHTPEQIIKKLREADSMREAEVRIAFAMTDQELEDIRWYLEDDLPYPEAAAKVHVAQVEWLMRSRGEELYNKVLTNWQPKRL